MSSSSVCQGLQSCLEPWIMEPHIQRFKLTQPKSKFSRSISPSSKSQSQSEENNTTIIKTNNKNDDCDMKSEDTSGRWSFLQCLTNTKETADDHNENVYVHPLVKRSSSKLTLKSLEMCTESLGSETGSLVSDCSDDIVITTTISSAEITTGFDHKYNYNSSTQLMRETNLVTKRTNNRSLSFPPPLTSISGVQVRSHREGGRLVLQAVTVSSSPSYFHAERSHGRLRLCLVKDLDDPSPNEEEEFDEGVYDEEDEDDEEEHEFCCEDCEDVEGENGKVGGEIGIEKLPRPSRCKEGGRGAGNKLIWEPFWVAT